MGRSHGRLRLSPTPPFQGRGDSPTASGGGCFALSPCGTGRLAAGARRDKELNSFRRSGARKLDASPHEVLAFVEDMGWHLVALTPGHAAAVLAQPLTHKDPFDELLLVQAQEEGLRLLTRDRLLARHTLVVG